MVTLIFFITAIIWGIVQAYSGEWTTGFILWSLAWAMVQANNAHVEAEGSRKLGQYTLAEVKKISEHMKVPRY